MNLRYLGRSIHLVSSNLVVDLDNPSKVPPLWVKVYDSENRYIGVLFDVIGPVNDPFAVVRVKNPSIHIEKGADLYYQPKKRSRTGKGGRS